MSRILSHAEHAAMVERTLTAVSTTCAELGIEFADVTGLHYDEPTSLAADARVVLDLDDERKVEIVKSADGQRRFTWTPAPAVPEPASVEQPTVREQLAEVRAVQRRPDFRESVSPDLVHALRVRAQRDSQELERMSERAIQRDGEIRHLRAEVERLTAELHAVQADPIAVRDDEGGIVVSWPEGARSATVSKELIDGWMDERAKLRGLLREALDEWQGADSAMYDERVGGQSPHVAPRIVEIRREAGLT